MPQKKRNEEPFIANLTISKNNKLTNLRYIQQIKSMDEEIKIVRGYFVGFAR